MRVLLVGLALALALLTSRRVSEWQTDHSIWLAAEKSAPMKPRPLVNLAADAIASGDLVSAEYWLAHAKATLGDRPSREVPYASDLIAANLALVRIGQGRKEEADQLMEILDNDPVHSARLQVCYRFGPCHPPAPR